MDMSNPRFAKALVFERVSMAIDAIKMTERVLGRLNGSLDRSDVRQSDFAHDADIVEHLLILREMKESLMAATASGGVLDQHFDREAVS